MHVLCRLLGVVTIALIIHPTLRAEGPPQCKDNTSAGILNPSKACTKTISLRADQPINKPVKPVQVPNNSTVNASVRKRPIDDCTLKVTSSPAPPETNPLATIFSILSPIGIKVSLTMAAVAPVTPSEPDKTAQAIEADITNLENLLTLPAQVMNLTECKSADGKDICDPDKSSDDVAGAFKSAKELLLSRLDTLMSTNLDSELGRINGELQDFARVNPDMDKAWQTAARKRLDSANLLIPALQETKTKESLRQFRDNLKSYPDMVLVLTSFPAKLDNVVFTGSVTCTNHFTNQPFGSGTNVTVTFKNPSYFSGSAGTIISPLSKRPIGILENQGTNAQGATTFTPTVSYTAHSSAQFIPSGFFNTALYAKSKSSLNFSAGVGLNPNNGSNQVEYIFGPSLQTHKFYFGAGLHVTRFPYLGDGFYIGEPVTGVTNAATLPIRFRNTYHLGIFVSYQPPSPVK